MTLENRVAIITGAAGGLGRVAVRRFADEGARLALLGRDATPLNELASELDLAEDRYLVDEVDLTDPEATRAAAKTVAEKFGRIEILLHLVGGYTGGEKLVDVAAAELSGMLDQHVWMTFNVVLVRSIGADPDRTPTSKSTKTTPEEIAALALYLCSHDAAMVNGARIPLYGSP